MDREKQLTKAVKLQEQFTPQVRDLLEPALTALGLDYFWYVRLMEGECHISIGIQPPLVELYRQRKTEDLYYKNPEILANKQTTVIWDLQKGSALTEDMIQKIGLQHGMCVFRRQKNYVDVWYVASRKSDSNLYSLYLNNTAAIYRLISFFNERVLPILPMKNPDFWMPYMDGTKLQLPPVLLENSSADLTDFYDATSLKLFTLHGERGAVSLTLREIQCVHLLAQGGTSKDIANELGLSFRTVEHYLDVIREKTGSPDRAALATLYRKNDIALWFQPIH